MKNADRDFDVVIVGAGVVGTVMADVLVARRRVAPGRVAVIAERLTIPTLPDAAWDLRVFALSPASQRLLEIAGIWSALPADKRSAYDRMCVWDARGEPGGSGSLTFDAAELGRPQLGHIVEGRALHEAAQRAASDAGVVFIEAEIQDLRVTSGGVRLSLSDGRDIGGELLIGADGTESRTRALLGIETAGHAYSQDALVAHVSTTKPHDRTAWQRFLPGGPLAFLPLPDGRSSIVWSAPRADAPRLLALEAEEFGAALTQASGGVLGDCTLTTPLRSFPLRLQYATDYVRPRAVLVGDAAHVVHPLAGQGLNLGLLDVASLADVLGTDADPSFFGEQRLLRRYERWRRSENLLAAAALDGLERLFSSHDPLLSRLRRGGLEVVGRLPLVKRELAERAMGLRGDVPTL